MYCVLLVVSIFIVGIFGECPDLSALRTDNVVKSFDAKKLNGFWYEVAYKDLAQIGETCQYYNKTQIEGGVGETFGFTYRSPRHMNIVYYDDDKVDGLYSKVATPPSPLNVKHKVKDDSGGIPTVVVDFTIDENGEYDTLTEYACFNIGKVMYEEIRLGARTPYVTSEIMTSLVDTLHKQGIDDSNLKMVDQNSECQYA